MHPKLVRRVRLGWLALTLGALLVTALPAQACGCGIYVPREGDTAVPQERALLRWDGATEDIVLSLSVQGSARDAAWILPVPSRATVQLGPTTLFAELEALTRPQHRVEWEFGGGGSTGATSAGAGGVTLLERQSIGPFDVSQLAATDASALRDWLTTNGYRVPANLDRVMAPYVERGWEYVAVKLTPAGGDGTLGGALDPLWVTFASDELVYPMRASALARQPVSVFLYVLAEHRVTTIQDFGSGRQLYASWVMPAELAASPALQALVPQRMFLTKLTDYISEPARIVDDYHFAFAADDTPYREVLTTYRTVPLGLVIVGIIVLLGLLVAGYTRAMAWRARRSPRV